MDACRLALTASIVAMAACQLDLAGKELVARGVSSGSGGSTEPGAASPDAMVFARTSDPDPAQDAGMPGLDVGQDAETPGVGAGQGPADASTAATGNDAGVDASGLASSSGSVDADAGGPCARLLQCCPRLLAPPLTLTCAAEAIQDGGDSLCEATLSSLTDAGVCP
jgi:hypothetical protein